MQLNGKLKLRKNLVNGNRRKIHYREKKESFVHKALFQFN